MPDEIAAAGSEVVEMLGACAAAPDDIETGRAADEALMRLEQALGRVSDVLKQDLAASSTQTGDGAETPPVTAGSSLSQKGSSQ